MHSHRHTVTRRGLAAGFAALVAKPAAAAVPEVPADPILAAIEAHRQAVAKDRKAANALAKARALNSPTLNALAAERKQTCKLRHNRRRDLRRATPTTAAGFRALRAYYESLIPFPDPDDVAGRCAADFAAAVARFRGESAA